VTFRGGGWLANAISPAKARRRRRKLGVALRRAAV